MRTGAAIAASLAAAMVLPGCAGAGGATQRASSPALRAAERPAAGAAHLPPTGLTAAPARSTRHRRRGARPVHPPPVRRAAPGRPAVPPSPLLRAFPILRRPERSGDRPAGQARALLAAEAREDRRLGEGAPLIAAARRLPAAPGAPPSWIVPAPERVCLLRAVPGAGGAPETIECVGTKAAISGYLISAITGLPGAPQRSSLEGVLPAGAHDARLQLGDGELIALQLHEGSYAVSAQDATTLRFDRGGRTLTVPVPHAPSGASPGL
jgi:hypothetical protein